MPVSDEMKSNVDLILNEASNPNAPNTSSIDITERPRYGSYLIDCVFIGDNRVTGERFEVEPFQIVKLTINQNFSESYMDEISLVCSMMPVKYLQLYDNSRGLKCSLKFTPCNIQTGNHVSAPTIIKEYLAVFKDKSDIRKKYSKESLVPDNQANLSQEQQGALIPDAEFQLINQDAYNLRKIKFNFVARNVTIKDVFLLMCKICNIKKTAITQPDNDKVYDNFIIPPSMSFEQTMVYIQAYYGVYNKGLGYYYTDETLYIYPVDETNPSTPESAHLYYVGNNYTGNDVNHAMSHSITHIILNDFASTKDLQDSGTEMTGNTVIIQDATRVIDQATTIYESGSVNNGVTGMGKVAVSELNTSIFSASDNTMGMTYNTYQPVFQFDEANPYRLRSHLNAYRKTIVNTRWATAVPFTFKPGYRVYYHYDGQNINNRDQDDSVSKSSMYTTKSGVCGIAVYTFLQSGKPTTQYVHTCTCDIALFLEPPPGNKEPTGNKISSISAARSTREAAFGGQDVKSLAGSSKLLSSALSKSGKVGLF